MHDVLAWLESSALGTFMGESGVWTYPVVNVVHLVGVASLFGALLILDLRLLGAWRTASASAVATVASPVATAGFVIAAASGVCLLAANALSYDQNPVLLVKFAAIGLGFVNAVAVRRTRAWRSLRTGESRPSGRRTLAAMGGVSLTCWLTAVVAGRLLGYF